MQKVNASPGADAFWGCESLRGEADITDYLDIPKVDASGVIDLTGATVKEETAKEPFLHNRGREISQASHLAVATHIL